MGFVARVCQPSTLRMLIWPEASSAQNNMAAVSADGSTVCVLILRLNSSCSRSIALVVRALRHWLGGSRVKVKIGPPQAALDEIVEHGAPSLGALATHLLDRQEHFLAVLAHPDDDQQRDGSGFAVEPHTNYGAVEDQPNDRLVGQRAGIPRVPVAL